MNTTLTAIPGLRVGHWTDRRRVTGVTAILCPEEGCVASASFLGPAPGSREAVLLEPQKKVERIHALVFSGGSAMGLEAASGVARYLFERGVGHPTRLAAVPIVPAAVIYDYLVGEVAWPDAEAGYQAAAAASAEPVPPGLVGAGTGATCGKYLKPVPTGLGSALARAGEVRVGALAVVNPVGDVYAPDGRLLAGHGDRAAWLTAQLGAGENTTLLAVGLEAPVGKAEARMLADAAQTALARVVRPSHTLWDGDAAFVLSTGAGKPAPLGLLGLLVQEAVERAVVAAVR
ncbi:P1 family peptidase [Oceanithermus sp.]